MAIRGYPRIVHLHRVGRVPHTHLRIVIPRTIVILPGLFVQLLAVEEIWRFIIRVSEPPLNEDLSPWGVLHLLHRGPEAVGHRHRAAEMVAVVEVNLAVAVQLGVASVLGCACRFRCVLSADRPAATGYRQVKVPAAVPCVGVQRLVGDAEMTVNGVDGVLLGLAHRRVVEGGDDAAAGGFVVGVVQALEAARERSRARRYPLPTYVVVFRPAVSRDADVRAGVDGVSNGVGALAHRSGVHPHRLAAAVLLHRAVAAGVVPVERHVAVLRDDAQVVLAVPQQLALRDLPCRAVVDALPSH